MISTSDVSPGSAPDLPAAAPVADDGLAAEVRESLLLLLLSVLATAGLAGAASAVLSLLG